MVFRKGCAAVLSAAACAVFAADRPVTYAPPVVVTATRFEEPQPDLPVGVADLAINVTDGSGQLVRRLAMGGQQAGDVPFSWDGLDDAGATVAPGLYKITAEAMYDGKPYAADTSVSALVESVTLGGAQGMYLNLAGLGSVSLGDVKQIS